MIEPEPTAAASTQSNAGTDNERTANLDTHKLGASGESLSKNTSEGLGSRYRLGPEIARGGMGAVFSARDEQLGREVAIKVLLDRHRDDAALIDRFNMEARIGGDLQHPGIVPVHELGTLDDGRPFLAMKLVRGRTLAEILRDRHGPHDDLLDIFEQVCHTLAFAHSRGVIHRDLKPLNVMVGAFGEVQVMDWGLAKHLDQPDIADARPTSGDLTNAGSVLGTPSYMPPEQAKGELDRIDRRSDVFGLGGILCAILTGESPYATLRPVTSPPVPPTSPSTVAPSKPIIDLTPGVTASFVRPPLPTPRSSPLDRARAGDLADAFARLDASVAEPGLIVIARRCLAAEPDDRFPDAAALADAVRDYRQSERDRLRRAEDEAIAARARAEEEVRRLELAAAEGRRRRRLYAALAASVLALVTLAGLTWAASVRRRQEIAGRVALRLAEVESLRNRAKQAPDEVSRWEDADRAAKAAQPTVAELDDPAFLHRLETLAAECTLGLGAARRDRDLLDRLADIRSSREDLGNVGLDAAYAAAFRDADLDLDARDPAAVGAEIRLRPERVAVELASYLEDWSDVRPPTSRMPTLSAASVANPDPFRDKIRASLFLVDPADRLSRLKTLIADPRAAELSPAGATLLGRSLLSIGQPEMAIAVLRPVAARFPSDPWPSFELAGALMQLRPARREEAVGYYRAAQAARPETAHALAHILDQMGRGDEAVATFADLARRRPSNANHLACFGRLLKNRGNSDATEVLARAIYAAREAIRLKQDDSLAHFRLGNALDAAGDHTAAITAYRQAIRLKPDAPETYLNLGCAMKSSGDHTAAIAAYRQAISLRPNFAEAYVNLGIELLDSGDHIAAIASYRQAIRFKPDLYEAHCNLGRALHASSDYKAAITAYSEAIRIKPDFFGAHCNLGRALHASSDYKAAITAYSEAIRFKPDLYEAHYDLGRALYVSSDYKAAIAAYREAIRLKPDDPEAHYGIAVALGVSSDHKAAIAEFRQAIRIKPDFFGAYYDLGRAFHASSDYKAAITAYSEAIRFKPDLYEAHYDLGRALYVSSDYKAAIAAYREAIRLKPDDPEAHYGIAVALGVSSDHKAAIAEFRQAIRLKPDFPNAHHGIGVVLRDLGDHIAAIAEFRQAIRLKPDFPEAHYDLGRAFHASSDYKAAIAAYHEAIRLKPDFPNAHHGIGVVLRDLGDHIAAIAEFRQAIRLKPDFPQAHCNLGHNLRQNGDYDGALRELKIGHELGSKREGWPYPSAEWVREAERLAGLAKRLPAVLKGDDQPKDDEERLGSAQICYETRRFATASRFWGEAMEHDPTLGDDRQAEHRYNAACAAALAASGKGKDEPVPDEAGRVALRAKTLGWLRAELVAWGKVAESGKAEGRATVVRTMEHWKRDGDLASVRDVASLPEKERADWKKLWEEVDALLKKAKGK